MTEPRIPKTHRLPVSLVRELEIRAELDGVPMTRIVEQALRAALAAAGEGSGGALRDAEPSWEAGRAVGGASGSHQPPGETIDLVSWLAEETGNPRSLVRMFIGLGRVTVGGRVCSGLDVERSQLKLVELDGERVAQNGS